MLCRKKKLCALCPFLTKDNKETTDGNTDTPQIHHQSLFALASEFENTNLNSNTKEDPQLHEYTYISSVRDDHLHNHSAGTPVQATAFGPSPGMSANETADSTDDTILPNDHEYLEIEEQNAYETPVYEYYTQLDDI